MNDKQRKVLWVTAVVLLLMLLFPPFQTRYGDNAGYGCIANPPEYGEASVNVGTLFIQFFIICTVGSICWFACKDKLEDTDPETLKELMKVFHDEDDEDDVKARALKLLEDTDPEILIELIGLLQEDDNDQDEDEESENK